MSMSMYTLYNTKRTNEYLVDKVILHSTHEEYNIETRIIERHRVFKDNYQSVGKPIYKLNKDLFSYISERVGKGRYSSTKHYRVQWRALNGYGFSDCGSRHTTISGALKIQRKLVKNAPFVNFSSKK